MTIHKIFPFSGPLERSLLGEYALNLAVMEMRLCHTFIGRVIHCYIAEIGSYHTSREGN
jgi:hypothetical protein